MKCRKEIHLDEFIMTESKDCDIVCEARKDVKMKSSRAPAPACCVLEFQFQSNSRIRTNF